MAADGTPVFCGDAIADPLTGLYAALAALAARAAGGGVLVDVAMAGVSADIARTRPGPLLPHVIRQAGEGWIVSHGAIDRTGAGTVTIDQKTLLIRNVAVHGRSWLRRPRRA